jgi:uncharacterized protein
VTAPIVFFDIAGPDAARLRQFYQAVFGWEASAGGNFTTPVVSPLPATFRQDPADKLLYVGVEDINATLSQITSRGGAIDAPRFEVPGVVVLALFRDPAGNRMGLVEMRDGKPIVP